MYVTDYNLMDIIMYELEDQVMTEVVLGALWTPLRSTAQRWFSSNHSRHYDQAIIRMKMIINNKYK